MYSTKTKQQQQRSDAAAAKRGQGERVGRPSRPQDQPAEGEVQKVIRSASQRVQASLKNQLCASGLMNILRR